MKRWILITLGAVVGIGVLLNVGLSLSVSLQDSLMGRVLDERIASSLSNTTFDEDGLHVVFCGTGVPLPSDDRANACTAVIGGGHFFLIDVGPGSWSRMARYQLPAAQIDGVFLTHFHSDHIGALGEVATQTWIAGRSEKLSTYGPKGVGLIVNGFNITYALDASYRINHHGADHMPISAAGLEAEPFRLGNKPSQVIFEEGGFKVTAFRVAHDPIDPAVGYRFDYGGRSVVVSGDTSYFEPIIDVAKDADVLIHEAIAMHMVGMISDKLKENDQLRLSKLVEDTLDYHTSPVDAARLANAAGVKRLLLTHLVPAPDNRLAKRIFARGLDAAAEMPATLAHDGLYLFLPAQSEAIKSGDLN